MTKRHILNCLVGRSPLFRCFFIYAMVSVSQKNLDYFIPKGIIKTDRLNVRSFKVYGDGALGSR